MPVLQRQIHQLRLKCARDEHARHGRVLLEDALSTASLGDEGRLVFVRRLNLGKIPLRASSTVWSLRLEERYRQSQIVPVRYDRPSAARAGAVCFPDATEPWLALALRSVENLPCSEWFWAPALPGWSRTMPPRQALALAFRRLVSLGGFAASVLLIQRLKITDAVLTLLQALGPEDLAPLQTLLGAPEDFPTPVAPALPTAFAITALAPAERAFLQSIGLADLRARWLAAVHIARPHARSSASLVLTPTVREIHTVLRVWTTQLADETSPSTASQKTADLRKILDEPRPPNAPPVAATGPAADVPLLKPPAADDEPQPPERVFTRAGGLFFLVPLFARVGLPAFLATLPPAGRLALPWQLLRLALKHARIPEDDALFVVLDPLPAAQSPLGRWLIAANRAALKLAGLNLRQLIRRTAEIKLTPTHVDLFFRATDADLRIRRTGLDIDPGLVAWLDRVVHFHFNRED